MTFFLSLLLRKHLGDFNSHTVFLIDELDVCYLFIKSHDDVLNHQ